jgi:hypothetical protein
MSPSLLSQADHHATADREEAARLAGLSMRERGDLLLAACRSATRIYQSRLASGLPIESPAPWPASTWEFLKAQAQHVQRTSHS